MTCDERLSGSIATVPAGRWLVGVSGGADSVALLSLLRGHRPDVEVRVAHLDHQTRGGASAADAAFVAELCRSWGLPLTLARRDEVEAAAPDWPGNRSARFRALRLALFRRTCESHRLDGVLLAHHADDQAETVIQRLLRGSGPAGLAGMRADTRVAGVRVLRPLLGVRAAALRRHLRDVGQSWREDESNASPAYQRNRVRSVLGRRPELVEAALAMGGAMRELSDWSRGAAPVLGETFAARELADLPDVLAEESARRWLAGRGVPRRELSPAVVGRLVEMCRDAATPPRREFPGRVMIGRRAGRVSAVPGAPREGAKPRR